LPNFTPVWTEIIVLASQTLARGSSVNGTLDLRTKIGAYLFLKVGRTTAVALTDGVYVRVRRTLANNTVFHPGPTYAVTSGFAAATGSTTVSTESASGQKNLVVTTTTNFVDDDILLIGGGTASEEWARVSKITAGAPGTLHLDRNLTNIQAVAKTVIHKADVWAPPWIQGGCTYGIVFDYGNDAVGDDVRIECKAQTYDSDLYTA